MQAALREQLGEFFSRLSPRVLAVYVFGSEARGTARAESDLDIALFFGSPPVPGLLGDALSIEDDLERLLGRRVEVVTLNTAPVDLVHRVFRDGVLLLDRNPAKRIRFEVARRNEFFDLQPVLEAYRRGPRTGAEAITDSALILKKLALIETYLAELRGLARPEALATDIRERRFVEHTLQLAIQAALDVASHIVSDQRLGEPRTNWELFDQLAAAGWLSPERTPALRNMAGFRNVLVHGYDDVDLDVVRDVLARHLDDLQVFVATKRPKVRT